MRTSPSLIVAAVVLAACSANEGPREPEPNTSATAPASAATAPASANQPGIAVYRTCLMWHVCDCNVGCVGIQAKESDVKEGLRATIVSGVEKGRTGVVVRVPQKGGGTALVLSDAAPDEPHGCSLPDPHLMGYGCMAANSGPVPKDACAKGCDDR